MATAITTTTQDITGDFDLVVIGSGFPTVLKALGAGGTEWRVLKTLSPDVPHYFVKNTGTNAYKLNATISGVAVEFSQ
jgi:hypothetical protein